jgi:hypothetical protein
MFLLSIACIAIGGFLASKIDDKQDEYAPKSYMRSLMARPKSAYRY